MAAYSATVTSDMKRAVKIDQVTGVGMFAGRCDVTNYNQTLAEITAITGKFKSLISVVCEAVSDNGHLLRWDVSGKAFKAYKPTDAHAHDFVVESSGSIGANMEIGLSADADSATVEGGTGISAQRTLSANTPVAQAAAAAAAEAANDTDVGEVHFIAYGFI